MENNGNNPVSQDFEVFLFLKKNKKSQTWLAKKVSTKKKRYHQPEISRALTGHDVILLQRIRKILKLG